MPIAELRPVEGKTDRRTFEVWTEPCEAAPYTADNAAMEAWNSKFKFECGERFDTNEIAEATTFDYIEVFYNRQRRHSAIGMMCPAEFEKAFTERQAA